MRIATPSPTRNSTATPFRSLLETIMMNSHKSHPTSFAYEPSCVTPKPYAADRPTDTFTSTPSSGKRSSPTSSSYGGLLRPSPVRNKKRRVNAQVCTAESPAEMMAAAPPPFPDDDAWRYTTTTVHFTNLLYGMQPADLEDYILHYMPCRVPADPHSPYTLHVQFISNYDAYVRFPAPYYAQMCFQIFAPNPTISESFFGATVSCILVDDRVDEVAARSHQHDRWQCSISISSSSSSQDENAGDPYQDVILTKPSASRSRQVETGCLAESKSLLHQQNFSQQRTTTLSIASTASSKRSTSTKMQAIASTRSSSATRHNIFGKIPRKVDAPEKHLLTARTQIRGESPRNRKSPRIVSAGSSPSKNKITFPPVESLINTPPQSPVYQTHTLYASPTRIENRDKESEDPEETLPRKSDEGSEQPKVAPTPSIVSCTRADPVCSTPELKRKTPSTTSPPSSNKAEKLSSDQEGLVLAKQDGQSLLKSKQDDGGDHQKQQQREHQKLRAKNASLTALTQRMKRIIERLQEEKLTLQDDLDEARNLLDLQDGFLAASNGS